MQGGVHKCVVPDPRAHATQVEAAALEGIGSITLEMDASSPAPAWKLDWVEVEVRRSKRGGDHGETYRFPARRWLGDRHGLSLTLQPGTGQPPCEESVVVRQPVQVATTGVQTGSPSPIVAQTVLQVRLQGCPGDCCGPPQLGIHCGGLQAGESAMHSLPNPDMRDPFLPPSRSFQHPCTSSQHLSCTS